MLDDRATDDDRLLRGCRRRGRAFAWMLLITGAAGLLASWVITLDKFKLLEDRELQARRAASTRSSPAATS